MFMESDWQHTERRINILLLSYWEDLRGDREMPNEDDLEPDKLGFLWQNCFLIQVRDIAQGRDYNFTYLGERIIQAYREGMLSEHNKAIISPHASHMSEHYEKVLSTRRPVVQDGQFTSPDGGLIRYRQSFLPLANAEGEIDAIFGGMCFTYE
ncbi:MAG: hypothetical protein CMM94_06690 [Rickettsiales bacterium]|nr:hypothetical protein [Rickettsiales bacterium]|tara:strand:- start:358 stop:816 length:459 start_codon:yes stop_codon:yes gene_type:complete